MEQNQESNVEKKKYFEAYSAVDITIIAIIAAAFGALSIYNQLLSNLVNTVTGVYGGMIVAGIFPTAGIMAYALVRKKGVAFVTMNLMGLAQILFGNPIGFLVLWFTLAHAIGQELTFFLFRYPKTGGNWRLWALAGVVSMLVVQIPNVVIFVGGMPLKTFVLPLIFLALPSSAVIPPVLTQAVVKIIPSGWIRRS